MKVAILGFGTTAMVVADIINGSHNFSLAGFVGTKEEKLKLKEFPVYGQYPFLGDYSILSELKFGGITRFIAAIGDNHIREEMFYKASKFGLNPINAISRNAIIHYSASVGQGVVVSPGVIISHGVSIEDNCIFDPSVVVDVNTKIGPHCYFYPNATICGGCRIEKNVKLMAGCIVNPMISVGKHQQVASGSVVSENLVGLIREEQ